MVVCDVLGLQNSRKAVAGLDDDEKNTVISNDGNRGNPNMSIMTESGLYSLIMRSLKPDDRRFKRVTPIRVGEETSEYDASFGTISV